MDSLLRRMFASIANRTGKIAAQGDAVDSAHRATNEDRAERLFEAGDFAGARLLYRKALAEAGDNRLARLRLGIIGAQSGDYADARAHLAGLVQEYPDFADGWNALGNLEKLQGNWKSAEENYRRALDLQPQAAGVWSNLGLCLREAGELAAADAAARQALQISPTHADALLNAATVAIDMGSHARAQDLLRRCLAVAPELAEAHTGLAHLLLQQGDFAAGWPEYEWRFRCNDAEVHRDYGLPSWQGESLHDCTLLIRAEQGLGDQIMFASCIADVMARSESCFIECNSRLVDIFARSFPSASVYAHYPKREPRWKSEGCQPQLQVFAGSLPRLLRTHAAAFPRHQGYLRADPVRVAHWRARLAALGPGPKVGISWRGGAQRTRRGLRSLPLAQLQPVLAQRGVVFVSLQYGDCRDEIEQFTRNAGITLHQWQDAIDNYDDTAALVSALDRVISVQTAVVHLAGACGVPVWALLPSIPEWRYMAAGQVMPWYPVVTLLRQTRAGDWRPVVERVAGLLSASMQKSGDF